MFGFQSGSSFVKKKHFHPVTLCCQVQVLFSHHFLSPDLHIPLAHLLSQFPGVYLPDSSSVSQLSLSSLCCDLFSCLFYFRQNVFFLTVIKLFFKTNFTVCVWLSPHAVLQQHTTVTEQMWLISVFIFRSYFSFTALACIASSRLHFLLECM